MGPLLQVDGKEATPRGGWKKSGLGKWRIGPFTIRAVLAEIEGEPEGGEGSELRLTVRGTPPAKPYELRWAFELPPKRCVWRGESGGGFLTPGPPEKGGDSLLGIAGSIFAAGEGLSAAAPRGRTRIDFAFDESGMCGLGGPTTRAAKGTYHESPDSAALRQSVMRSTATAPHLEWYLLADAQNFREAFRDQGGAREWAFRCGMRARKGPFDDADLYRFAAGFNRPGELVNPRALDAGDGAWLNVSGKRVLILAVRREGRSVIVDLFNTSARRRTVTLTSRLASRRRITLTDMLTRPISSCPRGRITIAAKAFARVVIA